MAATYQPLQYKYDHPTVDQLKEDESFRELIENNITMLDFPLTREFLAEATEAYNELVRPENVHLFYEYFDEDLLNKINKEYALDSKLSDRAEKEYKDNKIYIHVHPYMMKAVKPGVEPHPVLKKFLDYALHIHKAATDTANKQYQRMDKVCPGVSDEMTPENGNPQRFILRFLRYNLAEGLQDGDEIGQLHGDKSTFTFQIYEDAPGLYIITRNGKRIFYTREDGKIGFFKGNKSVELFPYKIAKVMRSSLHGIIKKIEQIVNKEDNKQRNAIVMFMHDRRVNTKKIPTTNMEENEKAIEEILEQKKQEYNDYLNSTVQ